MSERKVSREATISGLMKSLERSAEHLPTSRAAATCHPASSMSRFRPVPLFPAQTLLLLQCLQFFARLKPDSPSRRNRHLCSRPRIASNPGFPWPHVENSKPSELDPISFAQSFFHRFKDGLDRHFRFRLGDPRAVDDLIDDV